MARGGALRPYLVKESLQVRVSKTSGDIKVSHTFPELPLPENLAEQSKLRNIIQNIYAEMDIYGTAHIHVTDAHAPKIGTTVTVNFARSDKDAQIDSIADSLATDYYFPQIVDFIPRTAAAPAPRRPAP